MSIKSIQGFTFLGFILAFGLTGTLFETQAANSASDSTAGRNGEPRTLEVTGISGAKVSPDLVTISLTVEAQEKTAQGATLSNANITSKVIEALLNANVTESEIGTSYYNVYPVYQYAEMPVNCIEYTEGGKTLQYCPPPAASQILVGYKAINGIQLQSSKLEMAGNWIDLAIAAGANRVDSVYFLVSSERQNAIRYSLINDAVQDAHSKAVAAARVLGMEVIDVLDISLDSYAVIYPKRGYEYAGGAPEPSTPIIPGADEISASIRATFEIAGYSAVQTPANATISTSNGQEFEVALDSNPSTGYQWLVTGLDESLVMLLEDEYVPPESNLIGAGGKQVFTFRALGEGQTGIDFEYARPWELQNPEATYRVEVLVSADE